MIEIKKQGVDVLESKLTDYQEQFQIQNVFVCPNFLADELKAMLAKHFDQTSFNIMADKRKNGKLLSQEYIVARDSTLVKVLHFYLNQRKVIDAIREISGITAIKSFQGRVYKFEADPYSFDNWHDDMSSGRLLGMSLNLSEEIYQGGVFRIRDTISKEVYAEVKHDSWGSSHFFRINQKLEHMVEKVEGKYPRIAFAGWFMEEPFFNS